MSGQIEVTPNGIKVPQASEIKEAFQDVFINALGTDLSLDDATPQGNLIDGLTEQKQLDNAQILYFMNQFNPNFADGKWQDALASIYFVQRKQATNSVVSCTCTGLPGTVLNGVASGNPALAQSINGDVFQCLTGGTIPASGTIDLQFGAVETGPIPVANNTVNKIYNVVSGWDTVNNSSSGTVGSDQESRSAFAERIKNSLALNATGSLSSVYSHIINVAGVTDLCVEENDTDGIVTKRGIVLNPHSIYICENGAENTSELAEAIYNSKSAGCDTNGPNTCSWFNGLTGTTHEYKYYTPTFQNIYIKINTVVALSEAKQTAVKQSLLNNFNGNDNLGDERITIGSTFYASRFYKAVSSLGNNNIVLNNIKISTDGVNWEDSLSFNMNILPVLDIESESPEYVLFEVS